MQIRCLSVCYRRTGRNIGFIFFVGVSLFTKSISLLINHFAHQHNYTTLSLVWRNKVTRKRKKNNIQKIGTQSELKQKWTIDGGDVVVAWGCFRYFFFFFKLFCFICGWFLFLGTTNKNTQKKNTLNILWLVYFYFQAICWYILDYMKPYIFCFEIQNNSFTFQTGGTYILFWILKIRFFL